MTMIILRSLLTLSLQHLSLSLRSISSHDGLQIIDIIRVDIWKRRALWMNITRNRDVHDLETRGIGCVLFYIMKKEVVVFERETERERNRERDRERDRETLIEGNNDMMGQREKTENSKRERERDRERSSEKERKRERERIIKK